MELVEKRGGKIVGNIFEKGGFRRDPHPPIPLSDPHKN
jgi:hypothetical protein